MKILVFNLLIAYIYGQTIPLAPCPTAVFPLIFGGSGGQTVMKAFDIQNIINNYKIVAGGYTNDKSLATTATSDQYPLIIMYSGSLTSSINPIWGKLINDPEYQVSGIKFDKDAKYVVAHAEHYSNRQSMIIMIRASLLNDQYKMLKYTNSISSYNFKHKTLLVCPQSQFATNYFRIFFASSYNTGTQTGFYLQAYNFFDDLVQNPVDYILSSQFQLLSTNQNTLDLPYGLLLGENAAHLYLMHYQLDSVLISMIDSSTGAEIWTYQYNFPRASLTSAFAREYNAVTNEDIIVGVIGTGISGQRIKYLRLVVNLSTGEPDTAGDIYYQSVGFTDTFQLLGIIIENELSIRAYYYDSDQTNQGCPCLYFGTLVMSGRTNSRINVKRRMSRYPTPITAYQSIPLLIVGENRYFIGANGKQFYSQDKLMQSYDFNQGFIMGSVDQESCQKSYQDQSKYMSLYIEALSLTKLIGSISFQTTSIAVQELIIATIDIDLRSLTSKSSWCTKNPLKFIQTTQPPQPFIYISGQATQLPAAIPYTLQRLCQTSFSTVPSFQMFSLYYTNLESYITFDSSNIRATVDYTGPEIASSYYRIVATFQNDQWYEIIIQVKGVAATSPYINGAYLTAGYLAPINVHLSNTDFFVDYPPIIQMPGYTASIQVNQLAGGATAPSFFKPLSNQFQITTGLLSYNIVGTYDFQISVYIIQDSGVKLSTNYNIIVSVLNDQPVFVGIDQIGFLPSSTQLTVPFNKSQVFYLKPFSDTEGHSQTIGGVLCEVISSHSFSITVTNWKVTIFTSAYSDLHKIHTISFRLRDGQSPSIGSLYLTAFQFTSNSPPFFNSSIQSKHSVKLNSYYNYTLPFAVDPENTTPLITLISLHSSFARIVDQKYLIIEPASFDLVLEAYWTYKVTVSDDEPLSNSYDVNVTYTNTPPKFLSEKPKDQKVNLNKVLTYTLPQYYDEEGHEVYTYQYGTLNFVQLIDKTFKFEPNQISQIGTHTIRGFITDKVTPDSKLDFSFKFDVINEPPYFDKALVDQKVVVNDSIIYQLPHASDKEGLPIDIQINFQGQKILPSFIKKIDDQFFISPVSNLEAGVYPFMIALSDTVQQTTPRIYIWKVTILPASKFKLSSVEQKIITVSFKIIQITNYGEIILKFNVNSKEFFDQLRNATFNIKSNSNQEMRYSIISSDSKIAETRLFIEYPQRMSSEEKEILEIVSKDEIIAQDSKSNMIMPIGFKQSGLIPQQVSKQAAILAQRVSKVSNIISTTILPASILLNLFLSMFIQYLWSLMNDMSFLTILSLISISVPGIASQILSSLLNFIYLDVLMSEKWFEKIFYKSNTQEIKNRILFTETSEEERDQPLNQFFDNNGFSTKSLIKNLGSTFIYLLIYLFGYLTLFTLNCYLRWKQKDQNIRMFKLRNYLHSTLIWNSALRFILQQYPPLMISSMINFYYLKFGTSITDFLCSLTSLTIFIGIKIILILLFIKFKKQFKNTESKEFKSQYGTLIEGLDASRMHGHYWNLIVLIRWTFTVLVLVISRNYPVFQIFALLITSLTFLTLIFKGSPYYDPLDNKIALFNESMVAFYLYIILCITDFNTDADSRDQLGWALVICIFICVAVNFFKFLYKVGVDLRKLYLKKQAEKVKAKKEQLKKDLKIEGVTLVHQEINPYAYALDNQKQSGVIKDKTIHSTLQMLSRIPFNDRKQQTSDISHIPRPLNPSISEYEVFMGTFKSNGPLIEGPSQDISMMQNSPDYKNENDLY